MATQRRRRAAVATGTGKKFLKRVDAEQSWKDPGLQEEKGRKQQSRRARGLSKGALNCLYLDRDVPTLAGFPAVRDGPVTQHRFLSVAYIVSPLLWFPPSPQVYPTPGTKANGLPAPQ